jgi:hypothetical protein
MEVVATNNKKIAVQKTTIYKNLQLKNNIFRRKKQVTKDNINPNHYKIGNFETIDLIQEVVQDFGSVCVKLTF